MTDYQEGVGVPTPEGKEIPRTIYTARAAGESLVSEEFPNPWYVQRGHGTEQQLNDGKLVLTDLELVNGPAEAKKKAEEFAGEGELVIVPGQ